MDEKALNYERNASMPEIVPQYETKFRIAVLITLNYTHQSQNVNRKSNDWLLTFSFPSG